MFRALRALVPTLLVAVSVATAEAAAPLVEVDTCGQIVPDGAIGYLADNLDCSTFSGGPTNTEPGNAGAAVYLGRRSVLDLRGFTLTANAHGVLCDALLCGDHACSNGPCEVFNGAVVGNGTSSVHCILGSKPLVHEVNVSGLHDGVVGLVRLRLRNATISAIRSYGVLGRALRLANVTITGSGLFGVNAWTTLGQKLRLESSVVTGNGTSEFCDVSLCGDIYAAKKPRLDDTTCNTSVAAFTGGGTWGVCAMD